MINTHKLLKIITGEGWILGKLPGRSEQSSSGESYGPNSSEEFGENSGLSSNRRSKETGIEVLPEYELARDLVKSEFPLLVVTGSAGTGKSTFIRWLARSFEGHVLIAAPTGIAALNVDGKTLHSMCVLTPAWILSEDIKEYKPSIARGAKLLIIDEIKKTAAERWCRAVTNLGRFGVWKYHLCFGQSDLEAVFA